MDERPDQTSLIPYAGRWVAIIRGRVVAQGGTPLQAVRSAQAARFKEKATIMYVPTQSPLVYPAILERLQTELKTNKDVYLVGGAVRDALLGKEAHDLDLVMPAQAIHTARRVADRLGAAFFPLKEEFDAARLVITHPKRLVIDFIGMRGESLEEDLRARDFAINAIAARLSEPSRLLDPLGGAADLLARRLRACSSSSMSDDPVRVLRGIRLAAALQLKIEPDTKKWMRAAVPMLSGTTPERQRDELFQILAGPQPATALQALDLLGVLEVLLPELHELKGVRQSEPHYLDVYQHTMKAIQKLDHILEVLGENVDSERGAAENLVDGLLVLHLGRFRQQFAQHLETEFTPERRLRPLLFFATLYHDIGKPQTLEIDASGRRRFFGHDQAGAEVTLARAKSFRLSNREVNRVGNIVRNHMRPLMLTNNETTPSRRAVYRFFKEDGEAGVDICLITLADFLATYPTNPPQDLWVAHLETVQTLLSGWWEAQQVEMRPVLLLDGNDLMETFELAPGPQIGQILDALREAQAVGDVEDRETALQFVRELLES